MYTRQEINGTRGAKVEEEISWFILHKTSFGFKVYATGGNEETARLSGINTNRVRITNFIASLTVN